MPRLRVLSGAELVAIFSQFGFATGSQRGGHVKIQRRLPGKVKQTITIPRHREIDRGTLLAIYRQALRFLSEKELRPYFYTDLME